MKAQEVCTQASSLVAGDRAASHGDKRQNMQNIAALWNAWLGWRLVEGGLLSAHDVATMMELMKIARRKTGAFNPDDYVDSAGYAGVACEVQS